MVIKRGDFLLEFDNKKYLLMKEEVIDFIKSICDVKLWELYHGEILTDEEVNEIENTELFIMDYYSEYELFKLYIIEGSLTYECVEYDARNLFN